jgi:hypothetical protein
MEKALQKQKQEQEERERELKRRLKMEYEDALNASRYQQNYSYEPIYKP